MRRLFCLMLLLVLSGCSSRNVAYAPVPMSTKSPDTAEVVVIRDATYFYGDFDGKPDSWVVALDGQNYAELGIGQYTMFPVTSGTSHILDLKRWDVWWHVKNAPVVAESGQRYYFLASVVDINVAGLRRIDEEQARAFMASSRYVRVKNSR